MNYVPIQSYFKSTLAQIYNNEGEVKWDIDRLSEKINGNELLIKQLKECGYKERSKSFTAYQVSLIFKYLSHPILNQLNQKLLKMEKQDLLTRFENKQELITDKLERIEKLDDSILSDLGLRKNSCPDCNEHYLFVENNNYYFTRNKFGYFEMHNKDTLKCESVINNTAQLIGTLLRLRNRV
jgi:hypothetical protein